MGWQIVRHLDREALFGRNSALTANPFRKRSSASATFTDPKPPFSSPHRNNGDTMATDGFKPKQREDANAIRQALGEALGYDDWNMSQGFKQLHVGSLVLVCVRSF